MRFFVGALCIAAAIAVVRVAPQVIDALGVAEQRQSVPIVDVGEDRPIPANSPDPIMLPTVAPRVPAGREESGGQHAESSGLSGPAAAEIRQPLSLEGPLRQQSPLHSEMLTPGNFEYLGAFRPPHIYNRRSKFGYGGWGVTYRSDGDPDGPDDGHPGSLYLVGFPPDQLVAELSIPAPCRTNRLDDLSVARILQPFGDITGGLQRLLTGDSTEPFQIGGMQVVDGRLHWTLFRYYNVAGNDFSSHAMSSLRIDDPSGVEGLWHLGPMHSGVPQWHSYKHAGYIAEIPEPVAGELFAGRNLMSGLQISTGLSYSSQGPALFAYRLPESGQLAPDSSLDAVPLLWYSEQQPLDGHHPADRWTGAAWLNLGGRQAVVAVGRKAHGAVYYGEARSHDCYPYKGYHGSAYETQMLFYRPADLVAAASGERNACGLAPWYRWDSHDPGGGIDRFMFQTCGRDIGGMTYDRASNVLYIVEADAGCTSEDQWEPTPVIHAFRIVD